MLDEGACGVIVLSSSLLNDSALGITNAGLAGGATDTATDTGTDTGTGCSTSATMLGFLSIVVSTTGSDGVG